MKALLLGVLVVLLRISQEVAPTWVTSPFVKADWKKIISTKTGNTSTPTGSLTFSAPAFTAIPNLGYGISNYDGDDSLYSQMFEVNRTGLTTSSFSVAVQIKGYTNIWVLEVRYIAIDKAFPHHLNSFDNVPINYTKGALTNISTPSSTPQIYTNTINYTAQTTTLGLTYKNFSLPLTNNKVLLFITSLYITGVYQTSTIYPVSIVVNAAVASNQTYTLTVNASKNISITRLHFSMIVFDQVDVQSSNKYVLVYERINFTNGAGFYGFPSQFINNFIIGLTDLSTNRTLSAIVFDTQFVTTPSQGVSKPAQNCRNGSYTPVTRYGMTVFYLKTWICPNGTFFNLATNDCQACSIANCVTCVNGTACLVCNQAGGYFLNPSNLCQACTMLGCINCPAGAGGGGCLDCNENIGYIRDGANNCIYCDPASNQFVSASNSSCVTCAIAHCVTCASLAKCSICNMTQSYYLYPDGSCHYCDPLQNMFINSANGQCQQCALSNCITCASLSQCLTCNTDALYLLNSSNLCELCTLPNCANCLSFILCGTCASGFVINTATGGCETCALMGCVNCVSSSVCGQCDLASNYIKLADSTCQKCNTNGNYFANPTTNTCDLCVIANCSTCASLSACLICDYNNSYSLLHDGSCAYCNNSIDQFINMATLECDHCTLPHCTNCSSLTQCQSCDEDSKYELNSSDYHCYLCTLEQCLDCGSLTQCLQCNQTGGYFLNYTLNICQPCTIEGCLMCQELDVCALCDAANSYGPDHTSPNLTLCGPCNVSCTCDGYALPWRGYNCTPSCGDGMIRLQQNCDDNNTQGGDGCSQSCQQQEYYNCTGQPSNCTLMLHIQAQFIDISKQTCNGFDIRIIVPHFSLSQIKPNIIIHNHGIHITETRQQPPYIHIHAQYTRDIVGQTILLHLNPGMMFNITYAPAVPPLFYTKEECASGHQIQTMLQAVQVISYVILITSILSCKIVGLQLFGVLQLSYFTLSSHDFLNIYLKPLTSFRTFNGLNVAVTQEDNPEVPDNYKLMNIATSFINNCNVMLLVLFAQLILAVVVFLVGKLSQSTKAKRIGLRLLKQGFVTLVLFNILNISFSAGVHWKYADPTHPGYTISSLILYGTLIAMVAAVFAMELTDRQDYGEFKNKYKKVWICQLYIPFTIVYRMIIGFYIAVKGSHQSSTLIVLAFQLMFLLYIGVNLPFTNAYQNYRCTLIHITMFVILLTTNYYRSMKSNTPLEVKGKIYAPIFIQLVLIVACIGISFVVLIYEIYQLIKAWKYGKKSKIAENRKRHDTDQSFGNLG